jgi:hypothetical protein
MDANNESFVCPESTIESATQRGASNTPSNSSKLACESTIDSANRRDFIKKATLITTAAAVGGTLLGGKIVSASSAANGCPIYIGKSNSGTSSTYLKICCVYYPDAAFTVCNAKNGVAFHAISAGGCAVRACGAYGVRATGSAGGVVAHSCCGIGIQGCSTTEYGVFGSGGLAGVWGSGLSNCTTGVLGTSDSGPGIFGCSTGPHSSGVFGRGDCWGVVGGSCTTNGYGVWGNSANVGVIGTGVNQGVIGCSKAGTGVFAASSGPTGVPLDVKGVSGQTANLQQWEKGCTIKSVVNECGWLGIGTAKPGTSLQVNGSVAANLVSTSCNPYKMKSTCYAVVATAAINVTLPKAKTAKGMIVFIKNASSGTVTVERSGTDTIDGGTSISLASPNGGVQLISNGLNEWFVIGTIK